MKAYPQALNQIFRIINPAKVVKTDKIKTNPVVDPVMGAVYGSCELAGTVLPKTCNFGLTVICILLLNSTSIICDGVLGGNSLTRTVNFFSIDPPTGMSSGVQTKELLAEL